MLWILSTIPAVETSTGRPQRTGTLVSLRPRRKYANHLYIVLHNEACSP